MVSPDPARHPRVRCAPAGGRQLVWTMLGMPLSRCVWTQPLARRRLATGDGASTARTNLLRCWHLPMRYGPIAVHIRWSVAAGGSKDARDRAHPGRCSAMTMPPDACACVHRLAGVDVVGMGGPPSGGHRRGPTGRPRGRHSKARHRSPHGRAAARSVSEPHAHHHQRATTDRSPCDRSAPAPTEAP